MILFGMIMNLQKNETNNCIWVYYEDAYENYWETKCGNLFQIMAGTPSENKMKYCPYCGKLLKEQVDDGQTDCEELT